MCIHIYIYIVLSLSLYIYIYIYIYSTLLVKHTLTSKVANHVANSSSRSRIRQAMP